jgi:iron complex outermembrane receptor protein
MHTLTPRQFRASNARLLLSLGLFSCLGLFVHAQVAATSAEVKESGSPEKPGTSEEKKDETIVLDKFTVTVTARKRVENVQDVPISVSAFSGKQLEKLGAVDINDIFMRVPGLAYEGNERGLRRYNIRGVNSGTTPPTTGVYLDDVSLTPSNEQALGIQGVFDPVFFDIERVEVLKGPQGTLFGGGAMGGAIRYVSARPKLSSQSVSVATGVATTAHGSESYKAEAVVNVPIISNVLALRAAVYYNHEGGYIDNVANANIQNPLVSSTPFPVYTPSEQPSQSTFNKDDYNYDDTYAARVSMLWLPDPSLTIRPTIFYQDSTIANPGQFFRNLPGLSSSWRLPQPTKDRTTLASLEVVKDFGGVELTSLTAQFDRKAVWQRDYSFLIGGFVPFVFNSDSVAIYPTQTKQFSQELRIASDRKESSRLDWTLGLFYSNYEQSFTGTAYTYDPFFAGDIFYQERSKGELEQRAAFGEATYHITDNLNISAGVRLYRYEKSHEFGTAFPGFNVPFVSGTFSSKDEGVNPRVAVEYKVSKDHLLYVSAAKGFRPGAGQNGAISEALPGCMDGLARLGYSGVPNSYRSDSLWTYELGSKNEFRQGRYMLNGAVYQTDWKDIQQGILIPGCGGSFIGNAGHARIQGAEFEGRFNLAPGFEIGGTAGHMNARIIEPGAGSTSFQKGDRIQAIPKWTASAYALYQRPISQNWNIELRADYQYRSKATLSRDSTIQVAFPDGAHAIPNPTQYKEGYDVTSAYIALDKGPTSIRLYVNNVFDARPLDVDVSSFINRGTATVRPRTIGLEVRRQF